VLLVGQPTTTAQVDDVFGEAGFQKAVRLERGVGRSVVYPIAPIAECMKKGPGVWGQRSFCEKKNVRGVLV
jgi:hypothetical protein